MLRILALFLTVVQLCSGSSDRVGDVVGKLTVGYQGWQSCAGDDSPRNHTWIHWAYNVTPSKGNVRFDNWPDVREFTKTYETNLGHLGNGQPARLYSSWDDQTMDTQFQWMRDNGIDTVSVERFGGAIYDNTTYAGFKLTPVQYEEPYINGIFEKVMKYSEKYGRKCYVFWDISGWGNYHHDVKVDWNTKVSVWANSTAYARQDGKPVVLIWGFGFLDRPGNAADALELVHWLKEQGAYVIGGVPIQWRTNNDTFQELYKAMDMISPWATGAFSNITEAEEFKHVMKEDLEYLEEHTIDYQPVLFPGFGWHNLCPFPGTCQRNRVPRVHGDFMWRQFVNVRELAIPSAFVAMFDEFDEGTAIAKTAESKEWSPNDQYFYTLDADGVNVSSDFYLRLVNDGASMMKNETPLVLTHPTKHVL